MPLSFLSLAEPLKPAEHSPPAATKSPAAAKTNDPQPPAEADIVAPKPSNAITLPPIDWDAETHEGTQKEGDNEEEARRRRNLAGPSDSQLEWWKNNSPSVSEHHKPGDTERAEGEVITWQGDKCYWTTRGVTTYGMPHTSKVCKDPFKPDTEFFKDMRKKLDERDTNRAP